MGPGGLQQLHLFLGGSTVTGTFSLCSFSLVCSSFLLGDGAVAGMADAIPHRCGQSLPGDAAYGAHRLSPRLVCKQVQ